MIGLSFLAVALLWLALVYYLTVNLPRWLGFKKGVWPLRAVLLPLLLVGPFLDEIVGMKQFRTLCEERSVVQVSPGAEKVKRARDSERTTTELKGYWISIRSQPVEYIDSDSGSVFLKYEILHTKGGRIAGMTLMGGQHSCSPPDRSVLKRLDIDRLLQQGKLP